MFRLAQLELFAERAFAVNRPAAARRAAGKPIQHREALRAGLSVPPTIYSNDPAAIRAFLRAHGGSVVYKPLRPRNWYDGESTWATPTSRVSEEDLPGEELLRAVPGIYQAEVGKVHELRITVIGRRVFTARIDSQATERGKLDFRLAYDELRAEEARLAPGAEAALLRFMDAMGLVFGCVDMIVTPEGDHQFL